MKQCIIPEYERMNKTSDASPVFSVLEAVGYADGAVVSKSIVKRPTGTVTLFAFDKGEALSEHSAPFEALVQMLDGEALITIADRSHVVKKGDCLVLPANVPHAVRSTSRCKMMLTMIKS